MNNNYLFRLEGMAFLGLLSLIIAGLIYVMFLPALLQTSITAFVTVLYYLLIWLLVYIAMVMGAVLYYLVKPRVVGAVPAAAPIGETRTRAVRRKAARRRTAAKPAAQKKVKKKRGK